MRMRYHNTTMAMAGMMDIQGRMGIGKSHHSSKLTSKRTDTLLPHLLLKAKDELTNMMSGTRIEAMATHVKVTDYR